MALLAASLNINDDISWRITTKIYKLHCTATKAAGITNAKEAYTCTTAIK